MRKIPSDFFIERYGLQARLVNEDDAEFIVDLRTNPQLNQYINNTSSDVNKQKEWIADYKKREELGVEYYFIIQLEGIPIGTGRIYNIENNKFVSGSWVFSPNAPVGASVLGSIICKEIAYEELNLERDIADIRKDNKRVIRYNMSYEPIITGEDEENIYLEFSKEKFNQIKLKHISQCIKFMQTNLLRKNDCENFKM